MNEIEDNLDGHLTTGDNEISLLEILIILAQHKLLILGLPLLVAVITSIGSLSKPDIYTGVVKLLPPQQGQSVAAGILSQLGGVGGLLGSNLKNPGDVYVAMLRSRTVADQMVKRFGLLKPDEKYPSQVRQQLAGATNVWVGKDGFITVEVDDEDPRRAADLANAYVEELIKFAGSIAVTEASQRRLFFERQFAIAKDNLANAEIAARKALEEGGLVKVDSQGQGLIGMSISLRAQIAMKEVQMGGMRSYANDSNPTLVLAQNEVEAMKRELAKMEGTSGAKSVTSLRGDKGNDGLRLLREVKFSEVMFEQMARQYELAKIEEAKDSAVIQVMDRAIPPDRKTRPKRAQIVLLWTLGAALFAVLLAFSIHAFARIRENPSRWDRLMVLRSKLASV